MSGKYQAYPEYKSSGVEWLGDIPFEWEMWKLSHAYEEIGSGTTPPSGSDEWYGGNIPWVTTGELRESVITVTTKKVTEKTIKQFPTLRVYPKGSVAIAMYGATIGRLGIFGIEATTNQACCVLTRSSVINNKYLYYWLQAYRKDIVNLASGGGQPNINQEVVASLRVSSPKLSGQVQIANFLDHETAKIDTLIEEQQSLIRLLKEKRQAVISHAVTKGLNPDAPMKDSGVEWLGEVPEHWDVARIKHLSEIISKGTTPSTIGGDFVGKGIRFLKGENIGKSVAVSQEPEFFITKEVDEQLSRSRLKENDVLVIIAGATTGMASIIQKELLPANTNQAVSFVRPKAITHAKLIELWLSTEFSQRIIWMGAVQAAQPNLSMEDLGNIPIAVPPMDELREILTSVDDKLLKFDELMSEAEFTVTLLQERRTALIAAAVTGKIDIRNWGASEKEEKEQAVEAI
ncbi:restriction endonuclease subunit S [Endozoicomonas atrinae]|uniref:restriction endonuclease subunit S n=1 Tax=Endozoicomonas atrinae TaxID=1333660 RepID=UPI00082709C8|nr:restriction endonuclease subunit S [Endozoicomonas atrinae]